MATTVTKTVKESGGDFTSVGAALEWFYSNYPNFVTADVIGVVQIDGSWSSAETTSWAAESCPFITDATHYLKIYATGSARHTGKWTSTAYTAAYAGQVVRIPCDYFYLDGIQIAITDGAGSCGIDYASNRTQDANLAVISNVIIKGPGTASNVYLGIQIPRSYVKCYIYNTLIYRMGTSNSIDSVRCEESTASLTLYNCVVQGGVRGIRNVSGTLVAKNCYAGASSQEAFLGTIAMTTCASSDTTGSSGLQNIACDTSTFKNVTSGEEDFHLADTSSPLYHAGTDTHGDAAPMNFTTDIDGDNYYDTNGLRSIGIDELVDEPPGTSIVKIIDETLNYSEGFFLTNNQLLEEVEEAVSINENVNKKSIGESKVIPTIYHIFQNGHVDAGKITAERLNTNWSRLYDMFDPTKVGISEYNLASASKIVVSNKDYLITGDWEFSACPIIPNGSLAESKINVVNFVVKVDNKIPDVDIDTNIPRKENDETITGDWIHTGSLTLAGVSSSEADLIIKNYDSLPETVTNGKVIKYNNVLYVGKSGAWEQLITEDTLPDYVMFGFTSGTTVRNTNTTEQETSNPTATKVKETQINENAGSGSITLKVDVRMADEVTHTGYFYFAKNGEMISANETQFTNTSYVTKSETISSITLSAGDKLQVYMRTVDGVDGYAKNFNFYFDRAITGFSDKLLYTPLALATSDNFDTTNNQ